MGGEWSLMPVYEYKCEGCFRIYEVSASIHATPELPECCGKMERIFSSFGVSFKGDGWGGSK